MAIFLEKQDVAYFSVPKCACSTLKRLFFQLENDFPFRMYRTNGELVHIHTVYPTHRMSRQARRRAEGMFKFAVVRDPVSRILSCYRNRVVYRKELSAKHIQGVKRLAGLPPDPDLSTFVKNLERYRMISRPIAHHSQNLSYFLGNTPDWFDKIYDIRKVDDLMQDLRERVGELPEVERSQMGGPKVSIADLSEQEIAKIRKMYAEDYKLFGKYFEDPA